MGARFNPRAREGRDDVRYQLTNSAEGFNPRAREGRDQRDYINMHQYDIVSIHAPARGAT